MVITATEALRKEIPNIEFTIDSFFPEIDSKIYKDVEPLHTILDPKLRATYLLFKCIIYAILLRFFRFKCSNLINERELQRYLRSDLIIDLGGDSFAQPFKITSLYHNFWKKIICMVAHCYQILYGMLLGKSVVLYAHSVGPIGPLGFLIKHILNKMSLITLREKVSKRYLRKIGIVKPPIYVTADSAFLLNASHKERIDEIFSNEKVNGYPLVGMCLSQEGPELHFKGGRYRFLELMGHIIDNLAEETNAMIILLSHSIGPGTSGNDRLLADEISLHVKYKQRVRVFQNCYSSEDLKGIISRCDLFVGMRMHGNIAALSSCVPTIAIAYSWKAYGIMQDLGQERWICDIRELDYNKFSSKIKEMLKKLDETKISLKTKIPRVQELAYLNANLVRKLILRKL